MQIEIPVKGKRKIFSGSPKRRVDLLGQFALVAATMAETTDQSMVSAGTSSSVVAVAGAVTARTGVKRQRLVDKRQEEGGQEQRDKSLDCPYCTNLCIPPIFICATGHQICKVCRRKANNVCPTCQSTFRGRNIFLENYFNRHCTFPCIFTQEGCLENYLLGKDLKGHYTGCDFRPMPCISGCPVSVVYSKYLNHLENIHDFKFQQCDQSTFVYKIGVRNLLGLNGKNYTWKPRPFKAEGATFFAMNKLEHNCFGSWVLIFGNKKAASKFRVSITIKSEPGENQPPKYCQTWEGPVIPVREHTGECIMALGKCLTVSHVYILRIVHEEKKEEWTRANNHGNVASVTLRNGPNGQNQNESLSFGGADPEPEGVDMGGDFSSWTIKCKIIPIIIDG